MFEIPCHCASIIKVLMPHSDPCMRFEVMRRYSEILDSMQQRIYSQIQTMDDLSQVREALLGEFHVYRKTPAATSFNNVELTKSVDSVIRDLHQVVVGLIETRSEDDCFLDAQLFNHMFVVGVLEIAISACEKTTKTSKRLQAHPR